MEEMEFQKNVKMAPWEPEKIPGNRTDSWNSGIRTDPGLLGGNGIPESLKWPPRNLKKKRKQNGFIEFWNANGSKAFRRKWNSRKTLKWPPGNLKRYLKTIRTHGTLEYARI